jgi:hypothetical protein
MKKIKYVKREIGWPKKNKWGRPRLQGLDDVRHGLNVGKGKVLGM